MKRGTYQQNFSKKQSIQLFLQNRHKASLDATSSPEKADAGAKEQVVAPKEEVQAKPESKKETEDAVKPVTNPVPTVSGQDREVNEAQPATTPAEVIQGLEKSVLRSTVSRQWTRLLFENN